MWERTSAPTRCSRPASVLMVIAIEAAPDTAAVLRENAALNNGRIDVVKCAVGASSATVRYTAGQDSVNHVDPENASGECRHEDTG